MGLWFESINLVSFISELAVIPDFSGITHHPEKF